MLAQNSSPFLVRSLTLGFPFLPTLNHPHVHTHLLAYYSDAHHGNGVQSMYYGNKDVLTVSIHRTGVLKNRKGELHYFYPPPSEEGGAKSSARAEAAGGYVC